MVSTRPVSAGCRRIHGYNIQLEGALNHNKAFQEAFLGLGFLEYVRAVDFEGFVWA